MSQFLTPELPQFNKIAVVSKEGNKIWITTYGR